MKVLVVGAGLTGAVAARTLKDAGHTVLVREAQHVWGGNIRGDQLNGIHYEPHGAHIFHSDSDDAIAVIKKHCKLMPYVHEVKTEAFDTTISWPPQTKELKRLPQWDKIEDELLKLPNEPDKANFETYAISIMGETLYRELIYGYTYKQWGTDPTNLSSSFAPKRIDLRSDGYTGLFRDKIQGWPRGGWVTIIDSLLFDVPVELNAPTIISDVEKFWDAVIVTAPLDEFLGLDPLPWRGVRLEHRYIPLPEFDGTKMTNYVLPCGVVNKPGLDKPYTRRIETKHMSWQLAPASIVSFEYPGADARHYPIDDVKGDNRALANKYKRILTAQLPNAIPAGRLAQYVYIDTDQAVLQGLHAASQAMKGRQ